MTEQRQGPDGDAGVSGRVECVVFDLDGTLVDGNSTKIGAYHEAIRKCTDAPDSEIIEAHRRYGALNRTPQLTRAFIFLEGRDPSQSEIDRMVDAFTDYCASRAHESVAFAGLESTIDQISEHFIVGVASNAPIGEVERILQATGVDGHFSYLFGHPTSKVSALRQIASGTDLPLRSILYVGDTRLDLEVAQEVECQFVLMNHARADIELPAGTLSLHSFEDLLGFLGDRERDDPS